MERNTTEKHPVDWLRNEYLRRRDANPQYSLRAFAKSLEVPSGRLSELLEGKRQLTQFMGKKLANKLGLSQELTRSFLDLIAKNHKDERRKLLAPTAKQITRQGASNGDQLLSTDVVHAIVNWEHYAILSLLETKDARPDADWIARRLGISAAEVEQAVERLVRIGLLAIKDQQWTPLKRGLTAAHELPSDSRLASHKEFLLQAVKALDEVPEELRDISSTTMAVNPKKLPEAKRILHDFRRGLAAYLKDGPCDEVYSLHIQLIPVTKLSSPR